MSTNTSNITADDIKHMTRLVDDIFETIVRDYSEYDDQPGVHPVYRIGDQGYVAEKQWAAVFAVFPDWAPAVYEMYGNDPDFDTVAERAAQLVNEGGREAVEEWNDRLMDANEFDNVFWTEVGRGY